MSKLFVLTVEPNWNIVKNMSSTWRTFFAAILILFGVLGRLFLQDLPNIETIMVVALLAGSLLGGLWTIGVGLAVVAISDAFIGNSVIFLYTWSAWALIGFFGWAIRKRQKKTWHVLELTGMGVLGTFFFYLWTNFGVWHIGGLYPHTFEGLLTSYMMAIPFLRLHLLSTIVIVPTVSYIVIKCWDIVFSTSRLYSYAHAKRSE